MKASFNKFGIKLKAKVIQKIIWHVEVPEILKVKQKQYFNCLKQMNFNVKA